MSASCGPVEGLEKALVALEKRVCVFQRVFTEASQQTNLEFVRVHLRIDDLDRACQERCIRFGERVQAELFDTVTYHQQELEKVPDMMRGAREATETMRREYKGVLKKSSEEIDRKLAETKQELAESKQKIWALLEEFHEILKDVKARVRHFDNKLERCQVTHRNAPVVAVMSPASTSSRSVDLALSTRIASSLIEAKTRARARSEDSLFRHQVEVAQFAVESDIGLMVHRGHQVRDDMLKAIQMAQRSRGRWDQAEQTARIRSLSARGKSPMDVLTAFP
jgi:septal ring factor EnvC (AmiA/AmiB activator)